MYTSVFSKHFIECHYNYLIATQPQQKDKIEIPTLSEAIDGWIKRPDLKLNHWCPELFMSFHPENEIIDKSIFNLICTDPKLRKIEQWATKNILLCIRQDWKIQTRNVKFRIVSGMLNKLVDEKRITRDENIYMFDNIVHNMRRLSNDLLDSDLPF